MKKNKSKNLIVVIGNGFDLAHNHKTSFTDFANYYLNEKIINKIGLENEKIFSNSFIEYFKNPLEYQTKLSYTQPKKELLLKLYTHIVNGDRDYVSEVLNISNNWIFTFILKNTLLGNLFNKMKPNWFDVEKTYYDILKARYNNGSFNVKDIINLNEELNQIKKEFEKYLQTEVNTFFDKDIYYSFLKHFKDRENITFINFNYTNSINQYLKIKNDRDVKIKNIKNIHIHGKIGGNIVFGYGDDTDSHYEKMKNSDEKEFLRNFKTFAYLNNEEYRKVINEVSIYDSYEVLIIGHSLNKTDKTILKTILDNKKCDNIELLKRSDLKSDEEKYESHFELHANLSRIFDKETELRGKVIPFSMSINFPIMQSNDNEIIYLRDENYYLKKNKKEAFIAIDGKII